MMETIDMAYGFAAAAVSALGFGAALGIFLHAWRNGHLGIGLPFVLFLGVIAGLVGLIALKSLGLST
jgi:hypothetical protein